MGAGLPEGPGALSSTHVLLVDDSPDILEILIEILQSSGARVTAVTTAEQGLAVLERERPDVLLSDLEMPRHDGLWLIDRVRRLPFNRGGETPAACLTGRTGPEDRATVLRAGFQYHVPKPVRPDQLLGIVTILALKS